MKRPWFVFICVFTLLLTLTLAVTPALAKAPLVVKLLSVQHWNGKGVVFKFEISGDFKEDDLKGQLKIGEKVFTLSCNFNDNTDKNILSCVAQTGAGALIGQSGTVFMGNTSFFVTIPGKKDFVRCYDIWALIAAEFPTDTLTLDFFLNSTPEVIDQYCATDDPQFGDIIGFTHPQPGMYNLFISMFPYLVDDPEFGPILAQGQLPAMFVTGTVDEIGPVAECIPQPAFHGFGSVLWHEFHCFY